MYLNCIKYVQCSLPKYVINFMLANMSLSFYAYLILHWELRFADYI